MPEAPVNTPEPLYTKLPAKTTRYTGQSCGQMIQDLADSIKKITDAQIKSARSESKAVEKDAEKKKSGGAWDQVTQGPMEQYKKSLEGLEEDPRFTSKANDDLLDKFYNVMDLGADYAATAGNLVSGVVSNVVDELGVINAVSEAAGFGSLVPTGERSQCDKTLVAGTVGTIATIAKDAVSSGLAAVYSVQATIGMAFDVVEDMYAALMSMPASYLGILLTNRSALLDRVQKTVDDALALARTIKDDDYPFDHRSFILEMKAKLEEADNDLGHLESILAGGGKFQDILWDRPQETINEVADALFGTKGETTIKSKLIRLYCHQKSLELQMKLLTDRQTAFARIAANIGSFKTNIDSTNFQNLSAPIIQQIRCQIGQVTNDMDKTISVNALLKYLMSERFWGTQLKALYVYMTATKKLTKNLTKPSTSINAAADELSAGISAGGDSLISGENYDRLNALLGSYVNELKRKIARNVDVEIMEGMSKAIAREIALMKESAGRLDKMLNSFNNSYAQGGAVAMQVVTGIMGVLGDRGLDSLKASLYTGDLKPLFSSIVPTLESVAKKNISEVMQCCADNAGSGDARQRLINMDKKLTDLQKAKAVYEKYSLSYAGDHVRNLTTKTIPAWQGVQSDVTRVSRAPCMNQGQASTGTQLGLTVI